MVSRAPSSFLLQRSLDFPAQAAEEGGSRVWRSGGGEASLRGSCFLRTLIRTRGNTSPGHTVSLPCAVCCTLNSLFYQVNGSDRYSFVGDEHGCFFNPRGLLGSARKQSDTSNLKRL